MAKIEYEKLKEYCEYFLKDFHEINDDRLSVQISADRPDANICIGEIYSKSENCCGYSDMGIKFDEDTIHTFSFFYPDFYADEFDNTWEKCSQQEIYKILDEWKSKFKTAINNGYYFVAYENDNSLTPFTFIKNKNEPFNIAKIYNSSKLRDDPSFQNITRVDILNFHGDLVYQYNSSCKDKE